MVKFHFSLLLFLGTTFFLATSFIESKRLRHRSLLDEWTTWKLKHGRRFEDEAEEAARRAQFLINKARIDAHNKESGKHGFLLKLNKFADMSEEEYARKHFGVILPSKEVIVLGATVKPTTKTTTKTTAKTTTKKKPTTTKPKPSSGNAFNGSLDWRTLGAVTPVEEQGPCASCWAFSTTGTLEGRLKIKTGKLTPLSEQNLLDCSRDGNYGCEGGWMQFAYEYIQKAGGINSAQTYPYKGATTYACKFDNKTKYAPLSPSKPYYMVPPENETAMIEALKTGPVSVAFDSTQFSFQAYSSGVYSETECSPSSINHALVLVGYGTDKFTRKPYWIAKNTFGTDWGEKGYIRVARGSNVCGILSYGNYPILK